jgi:hypothetical protein
MLLDFIPLNENDGFKLFNSFPFLSSITELSVTTSPVLTELLLADMFSEITGLSFTLIFFDVLRTHFVVLKCYNIPLLIFLNSNCSLFSEFFICDLPI